MSSVAAIPTINKRGEKTVKRVTVQRYRRGVAPADQVESSSSSDSEGGIEDAVEKPVDGEVTVNVTEKQVRVERNEDVEKEEEESSSEDEDAVTRRRQLARQRLQSQQQDELLPLTEQSPKNGSTYSPSLSQHSSSNEAGSGTSESESSEPDSDQDILPSRTLLKPIFVPPSARITIQAKTLTESRVTSAKLTESQNQAQRKQDSANLLIEQLKLEERTKRMGGHALEEDEAMEVDDTDGVDVELEYREWKLRELKRLRRDRLARDRIEREAREVERIRALPEHERRKLEYERIKATKEKREQRTKMRFMQRYYHRGAFYRDGDTEGVDGEGDGGDHDVMKRDGKEATGDEIMNMKLLPAVMQVRDFGKMGRSKWTHLANEDTTRQEDRVHPVKGSKGLEGKRMRKMGGMKGLEEFERKRKRMV